ncbi:flavin reductase family protein [Radiobacillus deserti]|uniref:Flavin reductase n=1 Tax=Radiobacillus deserti TaxID=2594883 RepID=A0A516KFX9_9BACI|nr:flavin reductase family protein [Radiobacillus deserti]QDP40307.1 flavin reductase [Radiobacillus deserti]
MNNREFRDAMGKFATGITVITIRDEEQIHGMTVNAFMSVSLEPKLIAISLGNKTRIYQKLTTHSWFGISVLTKKQKSLAKVFARQQDLSEPIDFACIEEVPVLPNSMVMFACKADYTVEAGDHKIVIAEVRDFQINEQENNPILYYSGSYSTLIDS